MGKTKIYLANGLFSESDLMYNEVLYQKITSHGFEVYAPQHNKEINDKTKCADSVDIYQGDTDKLKWCDILVAVIDGPVIDPGVASEIGWVAGYNEADKYFDYTARIYGEDSNSKKFIIGLYTDNREASKTYLEDKNEIMRENIAECQYPYANLYTIGAIKKYGQVVSSQSELIRVLENIRTYGETMAHVQTK